MLICIAAVLSSGLVVYTSTPWSCAFDDVDSMLESLEHYIADFPNTDNLYGSWIVTHDDYHVEYRQIIIPDLDSDEYRFSSCAYVDPQWNEGINYMLFRYESIATEERWLSIIVYYKASYNLFKEHNYADESKPIINEGTISGYPYHVYLSEVSANHCHTIGADDVVICMNLLPSDSYLFESFSFNATGLFLPVHTLNGYTDIHDNLSWYESIPWNAIIIIFAAAAVFTTAYIILRQRRRR